MERMLQWYDDLDDLIWAVGLLGERIRGGLYSLVVTTLLFALQVGGVLLALRHPPLALAIAMLLFVSLLYRSVTTSHLPLEIV